METTIDRIPRPSIGETLNHIAPGGALLGSIYLFEIWVAHALPRARTELHLPLTTALSFVGDGLKGENWLLSVLLGLALLLAIYVTGHIIDSVSALCIDRTLVYRAYGYPYQHLFNYLPREIEPDTPPDDDPAPAAAESAGASATANDENAAAGEEAAPPSADVAGASAADAEAAPAPAEKSEGVPAVKLFPAQAPRRTKAMHPRWMLFTRSYYRVIFLWLNVYLFLRWWVLMLRADRYLDWPGILDKTADLLIVVVTAMLVGSFFLDSSRLRRRVEGYQKGKASWLSRFAWLSLRAPYEIAVKPLSRTFDTRRAFDQVLIDKYEENFKRLFGMNPSTAESNNYWFSLLFVRENSNRLSRILSHWQMMHEFSRNLSTAFYLAAVYTLFWVGNHQELFPSPAVNGTRIILWFPAALLGLAVSLLIHFYYLYVCYYSKFLYRAFVFLAEQRRPARRPAAPAADPAAPTAPSSWPSHPLER